AALHAGIGLEAVDVLGAVGGAHQVEGAAGQRRPPARDVPGRRLLPGAEQLLQRRDRVLHGDQPRDVGFADVNGAHVPGLNTSDIQSHMKCTPMVTLSTWQWWKPPSSRWKTFSVFCLEPTAAKHCSATASEICSSPAPCSKRNGQAIFCTMPASRKPSSFFSAASL